MIQCLYENVINLRQNPAVASSYTKYFLTTVSILNTSLYNKLAHFKLLKIQFSKN